jgi:hypothetical protein
VYDEAKPMGSVAESNLSTVIQTYLLGLDQELTSAIPRWLKWLDLAIAKDEKLGINHDYHRKELQWAKATGLWLEDNVTDEESWHKARVYEEVSWRCDQEPVTRREIVNDALDDYMAFSCQAIEEPEELEAGIDMYEHWIGATKLNLKKRSNPGNMVMRYVCITRDINLTKQNYWPQVRKCSLPIYKRNGWAVVNTCVPPLG